MSLILDALRKSEAERRRGDAPDLFAPMPAARPVARSHAAIVPVLAIAVVLMPIGIAWWRAHPAPTAVRAPANAELEATRAALSGASHLRPPPPNVAITPAAPSRPPPAAARRQAPIPAARIPAVQPVPSPPFAARPMASPAPATAPPPDARSAALPVDEIRLPRLGELDAARRANLPPLKLSMHVWDDNPDHRFAIVDGQRVIEGSELGGTLVRQIRRDGVVLSIDGRDYLLPR